MDRQEAYSILGVESGDKMREIRRKYHLLMQIHHPDVNSENADTARKLNEAFEIIKREGISSRIKVVDWGIAENKEAFCKRRLYMEDNLFGDEIIVDTGAYGKYYWEPDMESFRMLLKSIGEAINEIMDRSSAGHSVQGQKDAVRAKLLHLLIQEFIDPYECLSILYSYEEDESTSIQTFKIRCQIKPEGLLSAGIPEKVRIQAEGSRLYVYSGTKIAGRIVFEEDRLYYLVTPLFLQNAVIADLKVERPKDRRKTYMDASMILYVDPSKKKDMTGRINEEIKSVIKP